ncbi:MAG TPA: protein translocase subunit SecD [Methylomirabilota bacterium]|nr:protein translocase subunit SecD [Methylomirabilota bacterium]
MTSVRYRILLFVILALAASVSLLPTFAQTPSWWPWQQPIRLGLDLRGGTHLLYSVDIDQAIVNAVERQRQDLERELRDAQVGTVSVERDQLTIRVRLGSRDKRPQVTELIRHRFPNLRLAEGANPEAADLSLSLEPREITRMQDGVVEQALKIIRNRIDQFGVAEPTIQKQGSSQIVVQLPGIQDPQRAKELIGRTAQLEFKLVVEQPGIGVESLPGKGDAAGRSAYLVEKRVLLTGDSIVNASVRPGSAIEGMAVDFQFDARGAQIFGDITRANIGRQLAIVLDNHVESAPVIRDAITGGRGQITGNFDVAGAQDLANVLRNGALPAPLKLIEERTVGPSLGRDSIHSGSVSFIVGSTLVFIFMALYYRGGGLITDLGLLLNVLLLLGAYALFGFTLTLPGIAGIVLTVGMSVDANILILERMREELRLGKSARAAIEAGYDRAWSAILDSNITLFLSGVIMFQFGTGPVRGFAVTLCLGIATTLVTSVFATRVVYDWLVSQKRLATVSV